MPWTVRDGMFVVKNGQRGDCDMIGPDNNIMKRTERIQFVSEIDVKLLLFVLYRCRI